MSQQDTKEVGNAQEERKPIDDSDVTKVDLFTIIVVTIAGIVGIAWFVELIIEGFSKK